MIIFGDINAQFGVRASANLANIAIEPEEDEISFSIKPGLGLGVYYNLSLGESLSLKPEINYMQQGSKGTSTDAGVDGTVSISMNYLQIPVLLKYGFGNMESTNFFLQGGPYVAMGLGKVKLKSCDGDDCETEEIEYDSEGLDGPKKLDYGVQLGAGVNFTKNLSVDVRYMLGLANLTTEEDGSFKNNAINIGLGYSF